MIATVGRDYSYRNQRCWAVRSVVDPMILRIHIRYVALVLFFAFCQVIGATCVLPDLSLAGEASILLEEHLACPMDGATMCPPSLISSSERHMKDSTVTNGDHAPISVSSATSLTAPSASTWWSWSSVLGSVPISIGSSSVLRI